MKFNIPHNIFFVYFFDFFFLIFHINIDHHVVYDACEQHKIHSYPQYEHMDCCWVLYIGNVYNYSIYMYINKHTQYSMYDLITLMSNICLLWLSVFIFPNGSAMCHLYGMVIVYIYYYVISTVGKAWWNHISPNIK